MAVTIVGNIYWAASKAARTLYQALPAAQWRSRNVQREDGVRIRMVNQGLHRTSEEMSQRNSIAESDEQKYYSDPELDKYFKSGIKTLESGSNSAVKLYFPIDSKGEFVIGSIVGRPELDIEEFKIQFQAELKDIEIFIDHFSSEIRKSKPDEREKWAEQLSTLTTLRIYLNRRLSKIDNLVNNWAKYTSSILKMNELLQKYKSAVKEFNDFMEASPDSPERMARLDHALNANYAVAQQFYRDNNYNEVKDFYHTVKRMTESFQIFRQIKIDYYKAGSN